MFQKRGLKTKNLLDQIYEQKAKRYKMARVVAKQLTDILVEKYHVKKVILIGSCLKEEVFHLYSDIDLCVERLPKNLYFQVVGELMMEAGEFEVDIIPVEEATERMRKYIKKGDIFYERG